MHHEFCMQSQAMVRVVLYMKTPFKLENVQRHIGDYVYVHIFSVGCVRVTSSLSVMEGDTSFDVVIAVGEGIFILERELVYEVQVIDGTAEGQLHL